MIYFCQKGKKIGGHRLRFRENMPQNNTLNMKNRASLADKATAVSVSPKILQLDLGSEMFSAKYCLSGPIK